MHDTRKWTGTRGCKTNNGHSNTTLTAYQTNSDKSKRTAYSAQKRMADNNNNRQNPDKFNRDNQLKYHWGADDEIMKIINRRDNSPETKELVESRIDLTKPGHMRYQWYKKLDREILLPRRPNDGDRKEIKRLDIRLRRKECRDRHLGGGYFEDFGDEIPTTTGPYTETNPDRMSIQKVIHDTESTVSSTPEEPTTTQEPGTYPAIPVEKYRDGPIEELSVRYVRINHVIEERAPRNRQQEDNIRAAEFDFMLDLETLIKETSADPDLIELQCCLEDKIMLAIHEDYKHVAKRLTHRRGITMVDDRIIIPKSLRYAALNALHFGHPGVNKMCNDVVIFWWPIMRADIREESENLLRLFKCR